MAGCDARSPLVRSGTTQAQRDLSELDTGFFQIDERTLPDLVLYAQALSREIAYFDPSNQPQGDWEPFFASDVTATLARLARLPIEPFRAALGDAEEFLKGEPGRPEAELRAYFNLIFHLPVALFGELAAGHGRLESDHPLHRRLIALVEGGLSEALEAVVTYYKGAVGAGLPLGDPPPALAPADYGTGAPGDERPRLSETVAGRVFLPDILTERPIGGPSAEALGAPDWGTFCAAIPGDPTPYQQAAGPNLLYEQIYDALNYNLLSTELERVFQELQRARALADDALARSLSEVDDHAPHYSLFLAFLEMLAVARQSLNGMTARHLDFYYRQVLRMAPRAPVPDSVHVLMQLAKGVEAHLLPAGTELKAGKDATGAVLTYRLADDIVVNRGEIAELRAVRVHRTLAAGLPHETIHASPIANSADGLGADLPDGAMGWRPFGPDAWPEGAATPLAPFARVGFALADRKLFLREGERTITIHARLEQALPAGARPRIDVRLTGPEGWLLLQDEADVDLLSGRRELRIRVRLAGDQAPVVPYDPALHRDDHGAGYPAGLPVTECTFAFSERDDRTARAFAALRAARFEWLRLDVEAAGLRELALQTPDGVADPSKPFTPFGARPKAQASFLVGSAEAFAKPLASMSLKIDWETAYGQYSFFLKKPASDYEATVRYLAKGKWLTAASEVGLSLGTDAPMIPLPEPGLTGGAAEMITEPLVFGPSSTTGFIRLDLSADFGHAKHIDEVTRANIAMARDEPLDRRSVYNYDDLALGFVKDQWVPKAPYTPVAKEISLAYTTPAGPPARFFHVAPNGQDERPADPGPLLPEIDYEAALFVGIANFESPARLSLLAQVANGTGDPLLELPALQFSYLAGDDWATFDEADVDDKTGGFAASAVLGLALPEAADALHARMPSGLHWVRIAAPENSAAVNSLIGLRAQAVRAIFNDRGNDQFLAEPQPAGAISKLSRPDPKVKKVEQPFASFGGRPEEKPATFRRRASERLRHKDRASTIWDYERLALEAAPELYRVKCLNHTEIVRQGGKVVADNELSPGAVVVVTVPWTEGRPHLNPLRPYTDQATLKKVRGALATRISPFVRLEVANPKFEEVQVDFKVAFRDGIDDIAFYKKELEQATIGHLAPWSMARGGADITFGGRLRKSSIIDFIEELDYIDYLEDFRLYHRPDPESAAWTPVDMETVEATTARSIIVSAPAHLIAEIV